MNMVALQHNDAAVLKALDHLPTNIDDIYTQAMERIEQQPKADKELAERVLSWITYACRPLTVEELQHALAVLPEMTNMDTSTLVYDWKLTSVCAGLVVIDKEQHIIRLAREWNTRWLNNMLSVHFVQTTRLSSILKISANPDFPMLRPILRQHASGTFHSTYLRVATAMTMRRSIVFWKTTLSLTMLPGTGAIMHVDIKSVSKSWRWIFFGMNQKLHVPVKL
jgi:hypothetical protein